jgi:hypothetical protein
VGTVLGDDDESLFGLTKRADGRWFFPDGSENPHFHGWEFIEGYPAEAPADPVTAPPSPSVSTPARDDGHIGGLHPLAAAVLDAVEARAVRASQLAETFSQEMLEAVARREWAAAGFPRREG